MSIMINIVKSDIVRMLKSKSFWITLVAFLSLFVAIIFMQNSSQNGTVFDATNGGREEGLYITVDTIVKSFNSFVTTFGYSFGLLFLGIYLSIFICNEYSSGYIKNIATLNNGRISIIIAKIVVAIVLILLMLVSCYGLSFVVGMMIVDGFEIETITTIFKSILTMFLHALATFSLITFVATLFKSKVAAIIVNFLIASGMLLPVINTVFDLLNVSFLSKYTLTHFLMTFDLLTGDVLVKMMIVCIVYILVYNILSVIIISKRDL